jgi:hypothetical protein
MFLLKFAETMKQNPNDNSLIVLSPLTLGRDQSKVALSGFPNTRPPDADNSAGLKQPDRMYES